MRVVVPPVMGLVIVYVKDILKSVAIFSVEADISDVIVVLKRETASQCIPFVFSLPFSAAEHLVGILPQTLQQIELLRLGGVVEDEV